ncbi:MgtC/SapB family protein [Cohnella thailandensis]|uniref:MgtC/SapB family protein n=1 Tax=Cohnella thailandensis TaxID=557557 RepID=A0A841T693_9BACL|nr:MgtC/SapB family protein [Cohnella thailandensis]MBB6638459.1 MgtC/SapB family protein [Cohnella thailandensis]MBP1977481.1 putative Mg2+ transporter-C (MgtC) family protein [Cohnella thailandensis]
MEDPWSIDNWHLVLRLILSVILGGLIGFERERKNHAAGLRTHILVCLGSSLIMILSIYGFTDFIGQPNVNRDPARLAAQAITGIGFLGAGTIMFTGKSITGLTTAASLWVVMAIGLAVGAGFYFPAVISVLLVLLVLWGLNIVEKRYVNLMKEHLFTLTVDSDLVATEQIEMIFRQREAKILRIHFDELVEGIHSVASIRMRMSVRLSRTELALPIAEELRRMAGVTSVSVE